MNRKAAVIGKIRCLVCRLPRVVEGYLARNNLVKVFLEMALSIRFLQFSVVNQQSQKNNRHLNQINKKLQSLLNNLLLQYFPQLQQVKVLYLAQARAYLVIKYQLQLLLQPQLQNFLVPYLQKLSKHHNLKQHKLSQQASKRIL